MPQIASTERAAGPGPRPSQLRAGSVALPCLSAGTRRNSALAATSPWAGANKDPCLVIGRPSSASARNLASHCASGGRRCRSIKLPAAGGQGETDRHTAMMAGAQQNVHYPGVQCESMFVSDRGREGRGIEAASRRTLPALDGGFCHCRGPCSWAVKQAATPCLAAGAGSMQPQGTALPASHRSHNAH